MMKLHVIQNRRLWWLLSGVLVLVTLIAMALSWQQFGAPLKPGLDFVGGTRLQLQLDCAQAGNCEQSIDVARVRDILSAQGLGNSNIQPVDQTGLSIRTSALAPEQRAAVVERLNEEIGRFDPAQTQIDTVGPVIGQQILSSGLLSLLVAFAGITAYLSLRFQLDYAVFALVALFHDALITVGVFSVLGLTLGTEVDSLFLVALLTIVGFSVNDTVVIYDRIRETLKTHDGDSIDEVVDTAVNETLARSINTTLTTTLPLLAILLFGGETLQSFALALIIGFILGAYSSIFVASTLLAWWRERSEVGQPAAVTASDGPLSADEGK